MRGLEAVGTPEERALALGIANRYLRRLPANVAREDIEQAALIGLWDGIRRCRPDYEGLRRRGYLIQRIRGTVLDELRAQDWLQRRDREQAAPASVVRFGDLGTDPRGRPFEDLLVSERPNPEQVYIQKTEARRAVLVPIDARRLRIVTEHYWRERAFNDIAAELGLSESRVSQLHASALIIMHDWITHRHPRRRVRPARRLMQTDLAKVTPLVFERLLRHEVAKRRALGMSAEAIAAEIHVLPEVVDLVLTLPAPLRKCGP
jgi:RNA polymerase sigma factor (sigma-70 family)